MESLSSLFHNRDQLKDIMKNSNRITNEHIGNGNFTKVRLDQQQQKERKARSQRFSRAKTGCFTCRARRKKCDETRDEKTGACQRCLKSGIECLGFPSVRSAPLAAHSKKNKSDQYQHQQSVQQQRKQDVNTTTSSSEPNSVLPPSATDSSAGVEFFLGDFLSSNNPSINFEKSFYPLVYGGRLNSGNKTLVRSHSPEDSLCDPRAERSTSHVSPGQGIQLRIFTSSSLPPSGLDDWDPSDLLENFPAENLIHLSLPSTQALNTANCGGAASPRTYFPFPDKLGDEERALKSLAKFYSAFLLFVILPPNQFNNLDHNTKTKLPSLRLR